MIPVNFCLSNPMFFCKLVPIVKVVFGDISLAIIRFELNGVKKRGNSNETSAPNSQAFNSRSLFAASLESKKDP